MNDIFFYLSPLVGFQIWNIVSCLIIDLHTIDRWRCTNCQCEHKRRKKKKRLDELVNIFSCLIQFDIFKNTLTGSKALLINLTRLFLEFVYRWKYDHTCCLSHSNISSVAQGNRMSIQYSSPLPYLGVLASARAVCPTWSQFDKHSRRWKSSRSSNALDFHAAFRDIILLKRVITIITLMNKKIFHSLFLACASFASASLSVPWNQAACNAK